MQNLSCIVQMLQYLSHMILWDLNRGVFLVADLLPDSRTPRLKRYQQCSPHEIRHIGYMLICHFLQLYIDPLLLQICNIDIHRLMHLCNQMDTMFLFYMYLHLNK